MSTIGTKLNNLSLRCYRTCYSFSMQHNLHFLKPPFFPHYIQLELTNDCNLKCSHCSRQRFMDKRPVEYMDFTLFRKIIDEISAHPQSFIRIGGLGEQALHPEKGKIVMYGGNISLKM